MADKNPPDESPLAVFAAITEQIASGVSTDEIKQIVKYERLEPHKVQAYVQGVIRLVHPDIEALWKEFNMDEKLKALKEGHSKPLWDTSIRPEVMKAKYLQKKREILLDKLKEIEPEYAGLRRGLEEQSGRVLAQMKAVEQAHFELNSSCAK